MRRNAAHLSVELETPCRTARSFKGCSWCFRTRSLLEAGMKHCMLGVLLLVCDLLARQISMLICFELLLCVGMILRHLVLRTGTKLSNEELLGQAGLKPSALQARAVHRSQPSARVCLKAGIHTDPRFAISISPIEPSRHARGSCKRAQTRLSFFCFINSPRNVADDSHSHVACCHVPLDFAVGVGRPQQHHSLWAEFASVYLRRILSTL